MISKAGEKFNFLFEWEVSQFFSLSGFNDLIIMLEKQLMT